ncbi:hypothetical protein [Pseudomonas laurylsulfatiphila]
MAICLAITDADWSLTKDVFSVLGTLVSVAGVGLAFYVGLAGLATWRRQLKGTSDHELSRRALIELYVYRDAIDAARSPVMFGYECELSKEEANGLKFVDKNHLEKRRGYQRRLEEIRKARLPIYLTLLESEAIWGKDLGTLYLSLFKLQNEFSRYVEFSLIASDPREDEDDRRPYREMLKERRDVLYDPRDEEGDDFRREFNAVSAEIERYLKSKLIM